MFYDESLSSIVLCGGQYNDPFTMWAWDGSDWSTVVQAGTLPEPGAYTSAYHGGTDTAVVTAGIMDGSEHDALLDKTYLWDGSDWSEYQSALRPGARAWTRMVRDTGRDRLVLFGGAGYDSPALNDTWEYYGAGWHQVTTTTSPPARYHHALGYDPVKAQTILFGGHDGSGDLDDMWAFDGLDWQELTSGTNPPPGDSYVMAFDETAGNMVMFGGDTEQTWLWDGSDWLLTSASSPITDPYPEDMIYDPVLMRCVLLITDHIHHDDGLYSWNGSAWHDLGCSIGGYEQHMGYLPGMEAIVIFGYCRSFNENDTIQIWDHTDVIEMSIIGKRRPIDASTACSRL